MKKILVVEDEPFVRFFYREALSEFNIDEADNGFEAVEKLGENSYEIVLLDINIPFYNGIEVLKKIRDMKIDVKVIVLSAYGAKEKIDEAFELGAVDYLTKPVDMVKLKEKIKMWCL